MRLSIALACCLSSAPAFADCIPTPGAPMCTYYAHGQTLAIKMLMPRPDKICSQLYVRSPSGPLPVINLPSSYPFVTYFFEAKEKGKYDFRFQTVRATGAYLCDMRKSLTGGDISILKPWAAPEEAVHLLYMPASRPGLPESR